MKFYNPYQFIPLDEIPERRLKEYEKIRKGQEAYLRHDRWEDDALSGRIVCRLKTISPLVIGARQEENGENEPKTVIPYRDGQYLPANSLRGMIGSVVESISNSAMRVLSRRSEHEYAVRKGMRESLKAIGLLRKDEEGWFITPLALSALHLEGDRLPHKWQRVFTGLNLKDCLAHYVGNYPNGVDSLTTEFNTGDIVTYQQQDNPEWVDFPHSSAIHPPSLSVADVLSRSNGLDINRGTLKPRHLTQNGTTKGVYYVLGGRGQYDSMPKNRNGSPKKTHELFIPWPRDLDTRKRLTVTPERIAAFNALLVDRHRKTVGKSPFMPIGYEGRFHGDNPWMVKAGDLIYFDVDEQEDSVTELAYSAIWRRPVGNLYDALGRIDKNLLPWNKDRQSLTPAEALFGVIEKAADGGAIGDSARNLASRLRFHDAKAVSDVTLPEPKLLKILASPKPPSPSMYFRDEDGDYVSKSDLDLNKHKPNGRKRYLPHPDWRKKINEKKKWETQQENDNRKQKLWCRPIPDRKFFQFHIDFENLSPEELDLLRRAITPAPGKAFQHQLGLGKPLGLGQVTVEEIGCLIIDRKSRYSLDGMRKARFSTGWFAEDVTLPEGEAVAEKLSTAPELAGTNPLIDTQALESLARLGVPEEALEKKIPVCYPYDASQGQQAYSESEGFKWFVSNDSIGKQFLPFPGNQQSLPPLETYETVTLNVHIASRNRRSQSLRREIKRRLSNQLRRKHIPGKIGFLDLRGSPNTVEVVVMQGKVGALRQAFSGDGFRFRFESANITIASKP